MKFKKIKPKKNHQRIDLIKKTTLQLLPLKISQKYHKLPK